MGGKLVGERPEVVLACAGEAVNRLHVKEILLGLEEEGVLVRVLHLGEKDAEILAFEGALQSPLEVGIGLDHKGCAAIHYRRMHRNQSLLTWQLTLQPEASRSVGLNAARLVKVLPLLLV